MRQYNDNDIEVLGGGLDSRPRKISIWVVIAAGIIAVIAIAVGVYAATRPTDGEQEEGGDDTVVSEVSTEAVASSDKAPALPVEFTDSINDVVFKAVSLEGCMAAVSFEKPDSTDRDILLALPAADIRADNGEIVCEFIHDRQQLSRGVRKKGYCYIAPDGVITIGIGDGDSHKKAAINNGGTFFRQYPLVMDGEIQPNILKGKAVRRALAFLDGKPTIVISRNRESIYDFSQALADYGFSHAIYLPGGDSFIKMRTDQTDLYHQPDNHDTEFTNYLIFRH